MLRNENGGDNTLMFCFLLSSAYQKSRIFFFLVSCCACEKQKKLGGSMDGMDDQRDVPHHRTSLPVNKLGELSGKGVCVGWEKDIGQ